MRAEFPLSHKSLMVSHHFSVKTTSLGYLGDKWAVGTVNAIYVNILIIKDNATINVCAGYKPRCLIP